ncbi:MAG: hypothetical protein HY774_25305 [Acidobacteria bacterium]|nr:hypothetical protein [Acidobacteriota bacterium]
MRGNTGLIFVTMIGLTFIDSTIPRLVTVCEASSIQQRQTASKKQTQTIPSQAVYFQLFRQVAALEAKAVESPANADKYRAVYRNLAGLTDAQNAVLLKTAVDCTRQVNSLDARAKTIIASFRAQFPNGQVPQGKTLPPPPPELLQLQKDRDATILRFRDQLRTAFGEAAFARFDAFVQGNIGSKMTVSRPVPSTHSTGSLDFQN